MENNWVEDNWVEDNWMEDNWMEDNWMEDNRMEDNWMEDKWMEANWMEDNWMEDNLDGGKWLEVTGSCLHVKRDYRKRYNAQAYITEMTQGLNLSNAISGL